MAQVEMGSAIAALETEHKWLLARLAKVESAIAVLHELQSPRLPLSPASPPRRGEPTNGADVGRE